MLGHTPPLKQADSHIGVDAVQQYGFGQGDQSNESAVEQAKDEQISDFIRGQYKRYEHNSCVILTCRS